MSRIIREQAGASAAGVLCIVVFLAVVGVGSYIMGRDVIGEQYLKPRASPVTPQGAVSEPTPVQSAPRSPPLLGSDPFSFISRPKPAPPKPPGQQGPPSSAAAEEPDGSAQPPKLRRYTIQVGVYLDERNSRLLQEDLRNRGYSSRVTKGRASGRTVHKVQIGPYSSEKDAERMAGELSAQGYRVNVIPQG